MSRTVIIAQARMSSSRLPGKVLMDLAGAPIVDRVLERTRACAMADEVLIATTTDSTDDILVDHLEEVGAPYFRGSLDDVLDRYTVAARELDAHVIVRITCDCPLLDPEVIDQVISAFSAKPQVDYCSNGLRRTFPIGMDVEVFSREALERAHAEATRQHEREHVTPYLYQHPEIFRLRNVEAPEWARWPELRLTVDEQADLDMLRALVLVTGPSADLPTILNTLRNSPGIVRMNETVSHRRVARPADW